jgi:predicted DNA-binding transcriptional regulator YafY
MDTINLAGIPIMSVQGPNGGYGVMDTYKMDRQLVTVDDLFYIITALSSIGSSLTNRRIEATMEKMKSLLPERDEPAFAERHQKLFVDFSFLGGTPNKPELYRAIEKAVEQERLLQITYTNNRLESTERVLEPMTIAFKWRSWYLFAYCRLRQDYRLFRFSRIREPRILNTRFRRRELNVDDYLASMDAWGAGNRVELVLAFDPGMKPLVEEFFEGGEIEEDERGRLVVHAAMPEDGWVYGMILSYGDRVEVLSPERIRAIVGTIAGKIHAIYEKD